MSIRLPAPFLGFGGRTFGETSAGFGERLWIAYVFQLKMTLYARKGKGPLYLHGRGVEAGQAFPKYEAVMLSRRDFGKHNPACDRVGIRMLMLSNSYSYYSLSQSVNLSI